MPTTAASDAIRDYFRGLAVRDKAGLTDAELLAEYAGGRDGAAFEAIVRRHGPMVWGVCRRALPGRPDAEDAFQAVFLALARKAASVTPRELLPNWLHAVARTTALQARRAHARRAAHERRYAGRPRSEPAAETDADLRPLLDRELGRLPERYRVAVVLCDLEGLTRAEAARHLGWPEGTVAGRLARARALLAARLTRCGVTLPGVPLALVLSRDAAAAVPADLLTIASSFSTVAGQSAALAAGPATVLAQGVLRAMMFAKLKAAVAAVALASAALYGVAAALPPAEVPGQTPAPAAQDPPAAKPAPAAGGVVRGRVVRDADGVAVAGADVRLLSDETSVVPRPTTRAAADAGGGFAFAGVKPGKYTLIAFGAGLSSRTEMLRGERVTVAAGAAAGPVELRLRPGVSLKVRVLSEATGRPVPGARVGFVWTDLDPDLAAEANGEIEFPALTRETWTVKAAAAGYARVTQAVNLAGGEPAEVVLKLPPGAAVAGVVRDPGGQPLAGVGISAFREDYAGGQLEYVTTDAAGRYRFDHLPAGPGLQLSLSKLGYLRDARPLRLPAGRSEAAGLDVTLKPRPHGGSVRGVVTDARGKPVVGAELTNVGGSSDEVRRATTDAEGRYLLDDVYGGTTGHEFVVRAEGCAPQAVAFKPGPAAAPAVADVALGHGHRVRGRVLDPAGKPVAGVHVAFGEGHNGLGGVGGVGGETTTDAEGRFQFTSLPAATLFSFGKAGYSEIDGRELPIDGKAEHAVTMQPQGVVLGRVMDDASGKPLPRFTVRVTFSPDRREGEPSAGLPGLLSDGQAFASGKGEFRLGDLVAGMPLQVTVAADGYRKRVVRRVVAAADAKPTEFRLTREDPAKLLTYRGRLLDAKGAGVAGAELRLVVAGPRPEDRVAFPFNWEMVETGQIAQADGVLKFLTGTTAADGSFEFRGVPPDAEVELVYWGKGVPPGRLDRLDRRPAAERGTLVVKAPAPATLTGTIDRTAYPEFESVQLSGGGRFHRATVAADRASFAFEDLPAGEYELQVYGPLKRADGRPGMLTQAVLARRPVTLKEGERATIAVGPATPAP